jgi:hypothetical protein
MGPGMADGRAVEIPRPIIVHRPIDHAGLGKMGVVRFDGGAFWGAGLRSISATLTDSHSRAFRVE